MALVDVIQCGPVFFIAAPFPELWNDPDNIPKFANLPVKVLNCDSGSYFAVLIEGKSYRRTLTTIWRELQKLRLVEKRPMKYLDNVMQGSPFTMTPDDYAGHSRWHNN